MDAIKASVTPAAIRKPFQPAEGDETTDWRIRLVIGIASRRLQITYTLAYLSAAIPCLNLPPDLVPVKSNWAHPTKRAIVTHTISAVCAA
jgi:hypothetical protein